jgi:hypothetical protein
MKVSQEKSTVVEAKATTEHATALIYTYDSNQYSCQCFSD